MLMGVENSKAYSNVIAFMPAYGGKTNPDELKGLRIPTLIHWVKKDMMHNWNKFKPLAKKIPNVTIELTEVQQWKSEIAQNLYQKISDQITAAHCKFLIGIDPFASK